MTNALFFPPSGAPAGNTSLVSRQKTAQYYQRQCDLAFPTIDNATYGSNGKPEQAAKDMNTLTGGWDVSGTSRLLFVNGYVVMLLIWTPYPRESLLQRLQFLQKKPLSLDQTLGRLPTRFLYHPTDVRTDYTENLILGAQEAFLVPKDPVDR